MFLLGGMQKMECPEGAFRARRRWHTWNSRRNRGRQGRRWEALVCDAHSSSSWAAPCSSPGRSWCTADPLQPGHDSLQAILDCWGVSREFECDARGQRLSPLLPWSCTDSCFPAGEDFPEKGVSESRWVKVFPFYLCLSHYGIIPSEL